MPTSDELQQSGLEGLNTDGESVDTCFTNASQERIGDIPRIEFHCDLRGVLCADSLQ